MTSRPRAPAAKPVASRPAAAAGRPALLSPPIHAMFRGDPGRTGRTSFAIPTREPSVRWRFPTGRAIFSSPALDGEGNIYVGSLDGHVVSLDREGKLRWRRHLGDRVYSSPALSAAGVLVGSDADRFFLLEPASGKVLWSFALGPCPQAPGIGPERVRCDADSSPAVGPDGTIYFGGDALHALAADGSLRWRAPLGGHARSSPALDLDGNLYVGTQGGTMVSFDAAGRKRWEQRALYDFDATPALAPGGLLVVGCDDGRLYALRTADGHQAFVLVTRGAVASSAAVALDGSIVFGSDDGLLRALRPDGNPRWSFATRGPIRSSPLVDAAGRVLFGSQDDRLYALDSAGKLLWSLQLPGDIDSSPALAPDGTIYVGCDDGCLYAVR